MKLSTKIGSIFSIIIILLVYVIGTESCMYSDNSTIENISDVVQANTATAEQTAASTEVLSGQAISLKEMTERFKAD